MNAADVVIIGAGVVGASIAYHLTYSNKKIKVVVIEKEQFPGMGATGTCTGGIRHQFSNKINIKLTKMSLPRFKKFNNEIGYPIYFRQRGYLFATGDKQKLEELYKTVQLMRELDVFAEFYGPEDVKRRVKSFFPFIEASDLIGASYCSQDGYADPYGVTEGYLRKAKELGAEVFTGEEVRGIQVHNGSVQAVETSKRVVKAGIVVNAAGPHCAEVADLAGVKIAAEPYRRQVYVCQPMEPINAGVPLIVDIDTGFYLHVERNGILILGGTDRDYYPGFNTAVDWSLLEDFITAAIKRVPILENAKINKAYVGIRSITPDYNGILGETEIKGFYCAGGFSGHGFMHAPAIGIIMTSLINDGSFTDFDLSPLSPARFDSSFYLEKNSPKEKIIF